MTNSQSQPQVQPQSDPFKALSPEYKAMWEDILKNHPWIIREEEEEVQDNPELSNSDN